MKKSEILNELQCKLIKARHPNRIASALLERAIKGDNDIREAISSLICIYINWSDIKE